MAVGLVEENSGLQIPVLSGQGDGIDDVFGCGGIFRKLAYAFCDSAYITPANYADTLSELVALFYAFKSDIEDEMTDDELIEAMRRIFDGRAQGDLTYLADITLGDLCRPQREEIAYAEQEDDEW